MSDHYRYLERATYFSGEEDGPAPAPTSGNDEVEAMCKRLFDLAIGLREDGVSWSERASQLPVDAAALLRKQAAQIAELQAEIRTLRNVAVDLQQDAERAKSSPEEDRRQAEMLRDAERWRFFSGRGDDFMDDSDKLRMIAGGTVHYDAALEAAIAGKEGT